MEKSGLLLNERHFFSCEFCGIKLHDMDCWINDKR
jgi:hypothetical protein